MAFLTSKQIEDLNNSMVAAQNPQLGTLLEALLSGTSGAGSLRDSYTATADDATAGFALIPSGLAAISGWLVQILRAGVEVTADAVMTVDSTTNLKVADGGATYTLATGDVINFIIW